MIGNIYISGQIGTFDGVTGIELIDIITQVKKQPEAESFTVHINSEGGLVDTGFDIFHYLKSLGKPITTIGSGIVASIATIIFMAGSTRHVRENTPFMIHLPWGGTMGTADELEQFADQLRAIEKKMTDFYKKELEVSEEAILPLLKNETWLTEEQLTSLGFISSQPLKAVAKTYFKSNNNMNGVFTEKDKSWMETLFEKVLGKQKPNIVNKVVQDASGASIDFTDLPDDGIIEIGQKATIDGNPAEGEHVMPDGFTYVFTAGELTEIIDPEGEEEELAEQLATLTTENEALTEERDAAVQALATMKREVENLKKDIFSKYAIDGKKEKPEKTLAKKTDNRFAEARERIKNLKKK